MQEYNQNHYYVYEQAAFASKTKLNACIDLEKYEKVIGDGVFSEDLSDELSEFKVSEPSHHGIFVEHARLSFICKANKEEYGVDSDWLLSVLNSWMIVVGILVPLICFLVTYITCKYIKQRKKEVSQIQQAPLNSL